MVLVPWEDLGGKPSVPPQLDFKRPIHAPAQGMGRGEEIESGGSCYRASGFAAFAQDEHVPLRLALIAGFVHEGLDQVNTAAVLTFGARQYSALGPGEALGMVGNAQLDLLRQAKDLQPDRLVACLGRGILDGVVARFDQGQFAVHDFFGFTALFLEEALHGLSRGADALQRTGQLQLQGSRLGQAVGVGDGLRCLQFLRVVSPAEGNLIQNAWERKYKARAAPGRGED